MAFSGKFKMNKPAPAAQHSPKQAVIVYLKGEAFDAMIALSNKLTSSIEGSGVGKFDGNEIGGGETILFMYGQDAELLYKSVEPILKADEYCRGGHAVIRQGRPGSPQREIDL